jgi:hypothetical protein
MSSLASSLVAALYEVCIQKLIIKIELIVKNGFFCKRIRLHFLKDESCRDGIEV